MEHEPALAGTAAGGTAAPRLSATVILMRDDPFEVLMLERHPATHFPSAFVFPGGLVDAVDGDAHWLPRLAHETMPPDPRQRSLRIAAYRELFEEAGLFLGVPANPDREAADNRRPAFRDFIASHDLTLDLGLLHPFAHWITPASDPRRFDTHFYLAAVPRTSDGSCDGSETVSLQWVTPADALARATDGSWPMRLPTRANLHLLTQVQDSNAAIDAARHRTVSTIEPIARMIDGKRIVTVPPGTIYDDYLGYR